MTVVPPTVGSIAFGPYWNNFRPFEDIVSTVYRAGMTQTELVEEMKNWLEKTLVPYLRRNFTGVEVSWETQVEALAAHVDATVQAGIQSVQQTAFGFFPLAGMGIDLTGTSDSTAGVNSFFANLSDGDTVVIPSHATLLLSDQIVIPKGIRLFGTGLLKWTAGVAAKEALSVRADGTILDGIRMLSVGNLPLPTGDKQSGISISANNVTVQNCTVDGFQQGIQVVPFGEFYGARIHGNRVLNVPGSGGGPGSASPAGEDRGDGIVVWGSSAIVTGNYVTCKSGDDARIGIHTEALNNLEVGGPGPHSSAMTIIGQNIVTGKFRRGIAVEGVSNTAVVSNTVADSTWWGIGLIGGDGNVCDSNTITWTATTADTQGASWNVRRAAITVYGGGNRTVVSNNNLTVTPGGVLPFGINVETNGAGDRTGLIIHSNLLTDDQNTMYSGIDVNGGGGVIHDLDIRDNIIKGYNHMGIYTWNCADPIISGNRVTGNAASNPLPVGIEADGNASTAQANGNTITNCLTGIALPGRTNGIALGNLIRNGTYGLDFGGTATIANVNNTLVNVATAVKP